MVKQHARHSVISSPNAHCPSHTVPLMGQAPAPAANQWEAIDLPLDGTAIRNANIRDALHKAARHGSAQCRANSKGACHGAARRRCNRRDRLGTDEERMGRNVTEQGS